MKKSATPQVSYAGALGQSSADKRIEILRLIGKSGSISQAARDGGVSYKSAWQAIDTLTNLAGVELVTRAVGGAGGGGAVLSQAGLQLLAAAGQLELARNQVLEGFRGTTDAQPGAGARSSRTSLQAFGQLAIRTSMRNQLPCNVQSLEINGHIVKVALVFASGGTLVSRITFESAELLSLRPGLPVLALCKATAVGVIKAGAVQDIALVGNQLLGRAARVSRGPSGDEISITLEAGLQLVGFAAPGSGIRVGSKVLAHLDEAAVVVAMAS